MSAPPGGRIFPGAPHRFESPGLRRSRALVVAVGLIVLLFAPHRSHAARVYRDNVEPHWFADPTRFWYRVETGPDAHEFVLVDAKRGTREPAFDHARLATALSKTLGHPFSANRLPIDGLKFDGEKAIEFVVEGERWRLNTSDYALTKAEADVAALTAGDQPHPSKDGGAETRLTFEDRCPTQIADRGMILVQADRMGTSGRSKAFHDVCWQNLKDAGFLDRIAWIKAAAASHPQMDLSRMGIYGGSAGGQNALAALLWHHDFYKVAVADCGCHDNRMDKIWWNEQWMGWPVDKSYEESSNVVNAHLLEGKLMLLVGEMDDNVDPASTMQVVNALEKANKDFELIVVTGAHHGSAETPYGSRKRMDFLCQNLLAVKN